jgi:disulfide bond formation protein DsbB
MSNQNSERQMPAFLPALALLGSFALLLFVLLPQPAARPAATATATLLPPTSIPSAPTSLPPTAVAAAINPELAAQGQAIFQSTCTACHGLDGRGIPGLGKNLIESEFVHGLSDTDLLNFIKTGRDAFDPLNTTGIPMPPRGGNPAITDEELNAVIAFLRSQSSTPANAQSAPTVAPASPAATAAAAAVLPTTIPITPQPFSAEVAYNWSCAGCHGPDGSGIEPFGPGLQSSALLEDRAALLAFLTASKPPVNPAVEYPHPAQGGYPVLTDEQLSQLVDYLYSLVSE